MKRQRIGRHRIRLRYCFVKCATKIPPLRGVRGVLFRATASFKFTPLDFLHSSFLFAYDVINNTPLAPLEGGIAEASSFKPMCMRSEKHISGVLEQFTFRTLSGI